MRAVVRAEIGRVARCGIGQPRQPVRRCDKPLRQPRRERRRPAPPAPDFRQIIRVQHHPVIDDRILAERAVGQDQRLRAVLQPAPADPRPSRAFGVVQPSPADEQRGGL